MVWGHSGLLWYWVVVDLVAVVACLAGAIVARADLVWGHSGWSGVMLVSLSESLWCYRGL